jgi:hypothetical protein
MGVGILLAGCGMGSMHPGENARVNTSGATGCDSVESFAELDTYVNKDNDINRVNRELIYTGRCKGFKKDEIVNVIDERGDLRKVQRADGTELWTSWVWLGVKF